MKFIVEKEIFEKLPNACFGVVTAKGIDNSKAYPEVNRLLDESIAAAAQRFEGKKVKEEPDILPYRKAFRALDINPNENYQCKNDGTAIVGKYWKPNEDPYSIPSDGIVVKTFEKYGFRWGGTFRNSKDYMHFSYFGT